jgi:hypothetical protein
MAVKSFTISALMRRMKDIESLIDLNFLYAKFQKIYDGAGTISFKDAIKLALSTEHPEISESLFMYIFELIRGQYLYRINWIAFTVVIIELYVFARIRKGNLY